jgi:hypothetical protein
MRHALKRHPVSLGSSATQIDVEVVQPRPGNLIFFYWVTGKIVDLRIPPATPAIRTEQLWQTTCFEAFVRNSADAAYYEFNFAPSTQWAAYRFDRYRNGMQVAAQLSAPRIDVQTGPGLLALQASLELHRLPHLPSDAMWRLGISALLEDTSGRKSYWALAHPPGQPDFHHSDCFAHEFIPA